MELADLPNLKWWWEGPLTVENVLEHVLWWNGCSSTQKIRPKVYAIWWTVSEPLIHRWEHLSILWHLHRKQELVCVNHEAFQAETKYSGTLRTSQRIQLPSSIVIYIYIWLVVSTPLENMSSSVGMIIPNWMESHRKSCSKPPTRSIYIYTQYIYIHT